MLRMAGKDFFFSQYCYFLSLEYCVFFLEFVSGEPLVDPRWQIVEPYPVKVPLARRVFDNVPLLFFNFFPLAPLPPTPWSLLLSCHFFRGGSPSLLRVFLKLPGLCSPLFFKPSPNHFIFPGY